MTSRHGDPPIDARQCLPLQVEAVIHSVRLAEDVVRHAVAVINAVPFLEHVICFSSLGVVGAVLVNVRSNVGEEVGPVARLLEGRAQPRQIALVGIEFLAQERKIVLLEG